MAVHLLPLLLAKVAAKVVAKKAIAHAGHHAAHHAARHAAHETLAACRTEFAERGAIGDAVRRSRDVRPCTGA